MTVLDTAMPGAGISHVAQAKMLDLAQKKVRRLLPSFRNARIGRHDKMLAVFGKRINMQVTQE